MKKFIPYFLIILAYAMMTFTVIGIINFSTKKFLGMPMIFIWFYFWALVIVFAIFLLYQWVLKPWFNQKEK